MQRCPICELLLEQPLITSTEGWRFGCARCGDVLITGDPMLTNRDIATFFKNRPDADELHRRSQASFILRRQVRPGALNVVSIENMKAWDLNAPLPSVMEQLDELIRLIGGKQIAPNQPAKFKRHELAALLGTLIDHELPFDEVAWLCNQPRTRELLNPSTPPLADASFQLRMDGWEYYRQLMRDAPESRLAFMAMDFKEADIARVVTSCFQPAVKRAGFELRRLTDRQPAGPIDDQMRVALRTCRFVISDLTHGNRGAYWESGFAEGLGRPVIYTCRADVWEKEKTHFDTNHLATIIWNEDALEIAGGKLTDMIRATLPAEARLAD